MKGKAGTSRRVRDGKTYGKNINMRNEYYVKIYREERFMLKYTERKDSILKRIYSRKVKGMP